MYQAVIVDDESFVLDGMRTAIDWSGFNFELCCCTTNPCDALTYLEHHSADLLITDISMPQMTGIELIEQVRKINPLISILVLSAYDNFEYVRSAMRHGAENYLLKPLDPDELRESISNIVGHIQERAELSGTYGSTMLTFRSLFIENWVKGILSEDEFITRAQMLGINLNLDNYTVMIFTVSAYYPQGKEKMAGLFDYLLSLFVGNYISHFYFETPTRLVCIVSSPNQTHSIDSLLSQTDNARIILDFPFFISTGNTVDNYEEVSVSYRNAAKYLFLQYSPMHRIISKDMDLSMVSVSIIERDYDTVPKDIYMEQLKNLFSTIPSSRRSAFVLGTLNWGVFQTSAEMQPEPEIIELLKNIVCDFSDESRVFQYLHTFISTCYEIVDRKHKDQSATYPCVDAVIAAVHEFSDKDISLKTLAARLNMHPSYLGNIFRQQTGYYFNDYVNEERLKYAADLVEHTDMKLKEIVDRAGFSSQTYFNRQFKRKYGAAPNAYRREMKLKNL